MATKIALRAVVLSGGASRRMGRDKALLPHAAGGTWLEHITDLLNSLDLPVLVLTIHPSHEELLQTHQGVSVQRDATPGAGPLNAIAPVFPADQQQALLIAPVDMPELQADGLRQLISSWQQQPTAAAVAHDGERLQPLLGIYPGGKQTTPLHAGNTRRRSQQLDGLARANPLPSREPAARATAQLQSPQ